MLISSLTSDWEDCALWTWTIAHTLFNWFFCTCSLLPHCFTDFWLPCISELKDSYSSSPSWPSASSVLSLILTLPSCQEFCLHNPHLAMVLTNGEPWNFSSRKSHDKGFVIKCNWMAMCRLYWRHGEWNPSLPLCFKRPGIYVSQIGVTFSTNSGWWIMFSFLHRK